MLKFGRIGLIASLDVPAVLDSLNNLERIFLAAGSQIIFDEGAANLMGRSDTTSMTIEEFSGRVDLGVVVGGDGSMLSATRKLASADIPLLGINRGRLGFLTDISPDDIDYRVMPVLHGEFQSTKRFMLEVNIIRDGNQMESGIALNEVVLHPGMPLSMLEFELYVDGTFAYSQRSDGLIVATPTGSTAYALSAGGPLLFPELDAFSVVPLNPHTLSSRPIALPGNAQIEIYVGARNNFEPRLTFDGQNDFNAKPGDKIRVFKHSKEIVFIHPKDNSFFSVCRSKLGWGSRLGTTVESE
tara:strand:- start:154 stop:1050 length:897 start_codon:yes stop_codon:yes gene_type:complete